MLIINYKLNKRRITMITLLNLNVAGYIDPSVMTYAIQAIAGVVIAVGAFLGIIVGLFA